MCDNGQASMAYFYFYFRDVEKQHRRDLVTSLLMQLSSRSGTRCDILSRLYSDHDDGARRPNDDPLIRCLEKMLALPDQQPTYLIIDALDECSNISGIPTPRGQVLQLVKGLVDLHIPNLHICITSRPEADIRYILEPLTPLRVSLHDQSGQRKDIEEYVRTPNHVLPLSHHQPIESGSIMPQSRKDLPHSSTKAPRLALHRADESITRIVSIDGSNAWEKAIGSIKWVMGTLGPNAEVRAKPFLCHFLS